jgi:hypothetical protein
MWVIGSLWAFDYGHKVLKSYEKVKPKEFIVLIVMSLLSWIMLIGLFLGGKLKQGSDEN